MRSFGRVELSLKLEMQWSRPSFQAQLPVSWMQSEETYFADTGPVQPPV
jgi:hypothetical protein